MVVSNQNSNLIIHDSGPRSRCTIPTYHGRPNYLGMLAIRIPGGKAPAGKPMGLTIRGK
jgi:hypothetical protein